MAIQRLRVAGALIFALLLTAPHLVAADNAASAAELVGLWKAKKRFGPDARGPLIIQKTSSGWVADFVGRKISMRNDNDVLTFELPNGEGSFRALVHRDKGITNGQWFQPRGVGPAFGTGVAIKADGPNRWHGDVVPLDDTYTLYLMAQKRPDGSIGAFIRNPEFNIGVNFNVDRIERQGDDIRLIGRGPGQTAERVLLNGVYDSENSVLTVDLPDRGGTYDFRREGDESYFYPRGKNPGRYVYRSPLARDDGWPIGSLEQANIDRKGIENFIQMILDMPIESVSTPEVHTILIARHGKLVLEEYFHGYHQDMIHPTRSAGKSLTAVMVGAAMQAGAPVSLSSPVYQVMNGGKFPEGLEPAKRAMTLEHLLTMSSGYFCNDSNPKAPGNEEVLTNQEEEPDYYRFTLKVPMIRNPGEKAVYCSADPNLALGVLHYATGEHLMDLFDRLLGGPLQIRYHSWFLSPSRQPYGGGSANMTPRDFTKLGQLMLNGGTWNGKRILSEDFVKRASSPLRDLKNIKYGYLWWGIDWPYKDRTVHAYFAGGNGGQGVIVIPELDMVIGIYAGNYRSPTGLEIQQGYPPRYILPAVRERGDPKDAPVVPREYKVIYQTSGITD